MRKTLSVVAAVALVAGCETVESSVGSAGPRTIPTYPFHPVVSAMLRGRLEMRGTCLVVSIPSRKQTFLPIWPRGSEFDDRRVTLAVPGESGKNVPLGREVSIGGSGRGWEHVPDSLGLADVAKTCPFEPFFVVEVK